MRTRQAKRRARRGFSLLEVLLATTILLGAVVVLGELSRLALHNATAARNHTRGAELCARTMAEIVAGIRPAAATTEQPFLDDPTWRFAVELLPCDTPGLSCVEVICRQEVPENKRPIEVRLARWVRGGATSATASPTSQPGGSAPSGAGQGGGAPATPRASSLPGSLP
jgi:prepilin-type N-terminal cleavage/methylation domain-containing protein